MTVRFIQLKSPSLLIIVAQTWFSKASCHPMSKCSTNQTIIAELLTDLGQMLTLLEGKI